MWWNLLYHVCKSSSSLSSHFDTKLSKSHRHETSHACASDSNRAGPCKSKESAEKALSNLKASSTSRNLPNSSDPAKLAKRNAIEVMKMRRKAEPADPRDRNNSLKVEDRLFVTVSYNNIEKILWLRKVREIQCFCLG